MVDEASEDELVLEPVTTLGATGGAMGAGLGGAVSFVPLTITKETAFELVRDARSGAGRLVGTEARDDAVAVRALLGVGIGGLNPVVVTASVAEASGSRYSPRTGTSPGAKRLAGRPGRRDSALRRARRSGTAWPGPPQL